MVVNVYKDWYRCPNCQASVSMVDGDVCLDCGRMIALEQYQRDDESIYQHGENGPVR